MGLARLHDLLLRVADWERLPDRFSVGPDEHAERIELIVAMRRAIDDALTDHQRNLFVELVVGGVPLDALIARLGTTRGAAYKVVSDARRKIRAHLVANGYLDEGRSRS